MGQATGFLEYTRETPERRPVFERVNDWFEVYQDFAEDKLKKQAARCMDCGVPFCHTGCPVNNLIPDWNDLVFRGRWREAIRTLHATNNFPEFTGRICPAPCEAACVLGINDKPVTIKVVEQNIVDHAFQQGWVEAEPPLRRTGKRVAIIGSGPAGLAAAQQLNRAGHSVTVLEKHDRLGGLLRYGIPDFKLEKPVVDRRLDQLSAEGVVFKTNCNVGVDIHGSDLLKQYDAVLLGIGAEHPRDVNLPGSELKGVHYAMDYLTQQNRRGSGDRFQRSEEIIATGKRVVIIGGGDTGADCLGTAHRQKALSVHQLQIHAMPPDDRHQSTPWPLWPLQLRVEAAHEEGGAREWAVLTTHFSGDEAGNVRRLHCVRVGPKPALERVPESEFYLDADLVLVAIGFSGPVRQGLLEQLPVAYDRRGNVQTDSTFMTSVPGLFSAGDVRRGQSLVVWAIAEGRKAAHHIDRFFDGLQPASFVSAVLRTISCALWCAVVLSAAEWTSLYDVTKLEAEKPRLQSAINFLIQKEITPFIPPTEATAFGLQPIDLPLTGRRSNPLDFYAEGNQIVLPVETLLFIEDLSRTYGWLWTNRCTTKNR